MAGAIAPLAGCLDRNTDRESDDGDGGQNPDSADDDGRDADGADDESGTDNHPNGSTVHEGYETTTIRVRSSDGTELGTVTAAIADTPELRYLGLSNTDSLPADRGMLFVYDAVDDRTFVMREMSFGIDIVYADADGTITSIHHAPAPAPGEDGTEHRYPGRGQYVLEVVYGWTTDRGVDTGDVLSIDLNE